MMENGDVGTDLGGLELHERAPLAADVTEIGRAALDAPGDGVVRAGEEALGLELEVGVVVVRVVAHGARVAELDDHLSKEDAARVHVRHRQHVLWREKNEKGQRRGEGGCKGRAPAGDTEACQSVSTRLWPRVGAGKGRGRGVRD